MLVRPFLKDARSAGRLDDPVVHGWAQLNSTDVRSEVARLSTICLVCGIRRCEVSRKDCVGLSVPSISGLYIPTTTAIMSYK
jgi:hypothetical protein